MGDEDVVEGLITDVLDLIKIVKAQNNTIYLLMEYSDLPDDWYDKAELNTKKIDEILMRRKEDWSKVE